MKIVICQTSISWNRPEDNFKKIFKLADKTKLKDSLVLLPEMFSSGFSNLKGKEAKLVYSQSRNFLANFSKAHNCFVASSFPSFDNQNNLYNSIFVFRNGKEKGEYRKQHLFSHSLENKIYKPGNESLILKIGDLRISFLICYDLRFPYAFFTNAKKVDGYVVLANWPKERILHWETLLRARAIESQAFVVGVNRIGTSPKIKYNGKSQVIAPDGKILLMLDHKEQVSQIDLNVDSVRSYRRDFNTLKDAKYFYPSK